MKILRYTVIAFMSVILLACTSTSTEQHLENARTALADGNIVSAVESLDASASQLSDTLASPTHLTELAILYMIADSHLNDDSHLNKALDAYRRALKINADSVTAFAATLDPDDIQYFYILQSLNNSLDMALDSVQPYEDEEYDHEEDNPDFEE